MSEQITVMADTTDVRAVEIVTADTIGWHPGARCTGYFTEVTLPAREAGRVAYELNMRGYGATRHPAAVR